MKHTIELTNTQTRETILHVIKTDSEDGFLEALEDLRDELGEKHNTTFLVTGVSRGDLDG